MTRFGSAPLLVASNRGPLAVEAVDNADDRIRRGGGGLVSGIQAALAATPGATWVCAAMNPRERSLARQAGGRLSTLDAVAEALRGDFDVRMLPIDATTYRRAYNGVANATLWFVLHMLFEPPSRPIFDREWRRQWQGYERFNRAFAEALAEEAAEGATVMVQDYHLFLVPAMLRELRPDVLISFFTHTSWVSADYFRMLPDDVAVALLEGMLGADLLGFHTSRWAEAFGNCCIEVLGRDPRSRAGEDRSDEGAQRVRIAATKELIRQRPEPVDERTGARRQTVSVFPLGIDVEALETRAHARDTEVRQGEILEAIGDCAVIGRVDRTELSKNVLRGLLAYRELLRTHPEWLGRVVHLVFNNPSREEIAEYRAYVDAVEQLAAEIEDEFATEDWTPLMLEIGHDYPGSLAALRLSDVLLVNSLRDGMNLVALEGCVLSEREPAVVLSREAGAVETIGDNALLVNPFDVSQTAEALHQALSTPASERSLTAQRLRRDAPGTAPMDWFQQQIDAVKSVAQNQ